MCETKNEYKILQRFSIRCHKMCALILIRPFPSLIAHIYQTLAMRWWCWRIAYTFFFLAIVFRSFFLLFVWFYFFFFFIIIFLFFSSLHALRARWTFVGFFTRPKWKNIYVMVRFVEAGSDNRGKERTNCEFSFVFCFLFSSRTFIDIRCLYCIVYHRMYRWCVRNRVRSKNRLWCMREGNTVRSLSLSRRQTIDRFS